MSSSASLVSRCAESTSCTSVATLIVPISHLNGVPVVVVRTPRQVSHDATNSHSGPNKHGPGPDLDKPRRVRYYHAHEVNDLKHDFFEIANTNQISIIRRKEHGGNLSNGVEFFWCDGSRSTIADMTTRQLRQCGT